jgi:transposase
VLRARGFHARRVVCDGAGWRQPGKRFILLPPYATEFNPIENVWDYLRGNKLSKRVWGSYDAIIAACKEARWFFIVDPNRIDSIARRSWACVNL